MLKIGIQFNAHRCTNLSMFGVHSGGSSPFFLFRAPWYLRTQTHRAVDISSLRGTAFLGAVYKHWSAMEYSGVHCSKAEYSRVHCSKVKYSGAQ